MIPGKSFFLGEKSTYEELLKFEDFLRHESTERDITRNNNHCGRYYLAAITMLRAKHDECERYRIVAGELAEALEEYMEADEANTELSGYDYMRFSVAKNLIQKYKALTPTNEDL